MKLNIYSFVFVCVVLFAGTPAYSFYSSGHVNKDISYENLRLIPSEFSLKVAGTLVNKTKNRYFISVYIQFCNIHGEVLNSRKIVETIGPGQKIGFNEFLKKENYKKIKDAHHVSWEISRFRSSGKKQKKSKDKTKKNDSKADKSSYSTTREGNSDIYIRGRGKRISDKFYLPKGGNKFKLKHDGKRNYIVRLLNYQGDNIDLIANGGTGSVRCKL